MEAEEVSRTSSEGTVRYYGLPLSCRNEVKVSEMNRDSVHISNKGTELVCACVSPKTSLCLNAAESFIQERKMRAEMTIGRHLSKLQVQVSCRCSQVKRGVSKRPRYGQYGSFEVGCDPSTPRQWRESFYITTPHLAGCQKSDHVPLVVPSIPQPLATASFDVPSFRSLLRDLGVASVSNEFARPPFAVPLVAA